MKLTQSQMSCSCSRHCKKTEFAQAESWKKKRKKSVFLEVCHPSSSAPRHWSSVGFATPRGWSRLVVLKSDSASTWSRFSVAPRWWRTTTARQITPTPAWCRSSCTMLRPCCAAHRTSWPTGSSCWGSHTCRASWACAPVSKTPWPPSGGGSSSPWMHFTKVTRVLLSAVLSVRSMGSGEV